MLKKFIWDAKSFGLEIDSMDYDHQLLLEKMEAVYQAHQRHATGSALFSPLESLIHFTDAHFANEESYLESIEYPDLEMHKLVHRNLTTKMKAMAEQARVNGFLEETFFDFLRYWVTAHLATVDKKYASFQKNKKSA